MAAAQRLMAHDALTHIHACHMRLTHSFGKNEIESIRQQQHPDTPTHTNRHPATGQASASSSGNVGGGGGMTHSEAGGHAMVLVSDQVQRGILAGGAARALQRQLPVACLYWMAVLVRMRGLRRGVRWTRGLGRSLRWVRRVRRGRWLRGSRWKRVELRTSSDCLQRTGMHTCLLMVSHKCREVFSRASQYDGHTYIHNMTITHTYTQIPWPHYCTRCPSAHAVTFHAAFALFFAEPVYVPVSGSRTVSA